MLTSVLLVVTSLLLASHQEVASPTTVILVRHAEKLDESENPPLSESGRQRAAELARMLSRTRIDRIYTTPFLRTNETAEPVAKAHGLDPIVFRAGTTYAADLAKKIRDEHAGQSLLVVGHSNTTQQLLEALGIQAAPKIPNSQFDDLFICTIDSNGKASLVALRYGTAPR